MLKAIKGDMNPDGKIDLDEFELPCHPVQVVVTILEENTSDDARRTDIGDYITKLEDYEDQLSMGLIQWK
ncbi:MAG: hypothetical protein E3K37_05345 [Candidatus Kuenenia sp.]|nr:hypothetical protein [Candidatus Kuenenia hertensis]